MKYVFYAVLMTIFAMPAFALDSGDYEFDIQNAGIQRMYKMHVPTNYNATTPTPLLIAMHGGDGNMDLQSNDKYYGLITKSEQVGFIVVFPNGYSPFPRGKLATWNAGTCCAAARDNNSDDVGFIRAVVADVEYKLNIDAKRIYATGMSNGGMMSYRLACEASDVFAAIASVAGTDNTTQCNPARAISILHIHAQNDNHVLFNGGAGPAARDKSKEADFVSVPTTIAKWVKLNQCQMPAQRLFTKPGAYCEIYNRCKDGARVQLCVTEDGGHSWPGGEKPRNGRLFGTSTQPPSQAISADDVMWDFFTHTQQ